MNATVEVTPAVETETLALLAGYDATTATQFDEAIAKQQDNVRTALEKHATNRGRQPDPLSGDRPVYLLLAVVPSLLARRRFEGLRARTPGGTPAPTAPTLPAESKAILMGAFGPLGPDKWVPLWQAMGEYLKGPLVERLAEVDGRLAKYRVARDPARVLGWEEPRALVKANRLSPTHAAPIDGAVWFVSRLVAEHHDLVDRIARLQTPAAAGKATMHPALAKAVGSAGGQAAISSRLAESRRVRGVFYAADSGGPELADAEALLKGLDDDAAALGDQPGGLAVDLAADRKRTADRVAKLRAEIAPRQQAAAADLVSKALSGNAESRAALVSEIRARESLWPTAPELIAGLALDHVDGVPLDAVVDEIVRRLAPASYQLMALPAPAASA